MMNDDNNIIEKELKMKTEISNQILFHHLSFILQILFDDIGEFRKKMKKAVNNLHTYMF